jgi:hypothetical protein
MIKEVLKRMFSSRVQGCMCMARRDISMRFLGGFALICGCFGVV